MRLIDAYELLDRHTEIRKVGKKIIEYVTVENIVNAPTVDAEPVRHGKWIEYPTADGMNQCSVCGVLRFGDSNYCPNCGAKMDEEAET